MLNTSQVLIRNLPLYEKGNTLFIGLSDEPLLRKWPSGQYHVITNHYGDFERIRLVNEQRVSFSGTFATVWESVSTIDQVIIVLPKSRELLACWLSQLQTLLSSDTWVYLVGEKNAGIQGAAKQLAKYATQTEKLDTARHCHLWRARLSVQQTVFSLDQWWTPITGSGEDNIAPCYSIPGVFNHGKLDEGTALLLQNMGRLSKGRVLDFGCGAGVLGLSIKQQQPDATVEMLDVSAEAVMASQYSAAQQNLDVTVFPSNGLGSVHGRYHQVFSNPPFHTGVKTDYQISEAFFKGVGQHLVDNGELRIVANAFLKYPPLIEQFIGPCQVVARTSKFVVYSARKRIR